jgi:hypothetical protein
MKVFLKHETTVREKNVQIAFMLKLRLLFIRKFLKRKHYQLGRTYFQQIQATEGLVSRIKGQALEAHVYNPSYLEG